MTHIESYNERLFSGTGVRSFFHLARFEWAKKTVAQLGFTSLNLVEIGCYDGRLIDYMPVRVDLYRGYDAGWEQGLDAGQKRFAGQTNYRFERAVDPTPLTEHEDGEFNLGASLETFEHISPGIVDPYLEELARIVDGHLIVTVPNEKGIVFLGKYLAKRLKFGGNEPYTFREVILATLGQLDSIERIEHKGFDYSKLIGQIERHFDIVKVEGIPFRWLPLSLSFTIGISARSKREQTAGKAD